MKNFVKTSRKKLAGSARKYLPRYYDPSRKYRRYYDRHFDHAIIKDKTILYEVRDGQSMTDSPLYIFKMLVKDQSFKDYKHIWVIKPEVDVAQFMVNIPETMRDQVELVTRNSMAYVKWLLEAQYLITNSTFQNYFHKRPGQVYVNTWHGTPLKFMGYDIPGSKTSLKNVQRNFLMTDYLISPNEHTTNIFLDRYKLDGMYEGVVLQTGYPRNDILQGVDDALYTDLRNFGLKIDQRPIVLYTPTWKGTSVTNPSGSMQQILAEVNVLQDKNPDKQILVKVHPYAYEQALNEPELVKILIPDVIDANRILSITDILVTDYSSIFFDFLATNRPIVFYAWDKEQYDLYRGMYLIEEEMPAPVLTDIQKVADYISKKQIPITPQYQQLKKRMVSLEDGAVTGRVVRRIFNHKTLPEGQEIRLINDKKKILIFTGGMVNNGITASLQNLTSNIDYRQYDISVITWDSNQREKVANVNRLNENIRILYRFGWSSFTLWDSLGDKIIQHTGIHGWNRWLVPQKGYQRDIHRLLGDTQFDAAIDFSGYSYNGSRVIAFSNAKVKSVFQHNDLWMDAHKVVRGKQPNKRGLMALFSLYYRYNHIVSVSEKLAQINANKLSKYIKKGQQTYSKNTLNLTEKSSVDRIADVEITSGNFKVTVNSDTIATYRTLDDYKVNVQQTEYFNSSDHLIGVAKAEYRDGKTLIKLIKNGLPASWVDLNKIVVQQDVEIISEKTVAEVGWIKRNNRLILEFPDESSFEGITRGKLLNNSFTTIDQVVQTNFGEFVRLTIPGSHQKGYLNASSVKILSSNKLTLLQKIWNLRKNGEDYFNRTPRLIKLIFDNKNPLIWNEPPKVSSNSKVIKDKKLKNNQFYIMDGISRFNGQEYARIIDENSKRVWILSEYCHSFDIEVAATAIGSNTDELMLADETKDGYKIDRTILGDKLIDGRISILSVNNHVNQNDMLLFDPVAQVFKWEPTIGSTAQNEVDGQTRIEPSLNVSDVQQSVKNIQEKFSVDTAQLNLVKPHALLDMRTNDNDILMTREVDIDEFNEIKNKSIICFDEINGNVVEQTVLSNLSDIKRVQRLLTRGGEIWFQIEHLTGTQTTFKVIDQNVITTPLSPDNGSEQFVNHLIYLSMGRLSPEKNHISMIIAFKAVLAAKPNAYLWILGDGKMRHDLEQLAIALHIQDHVIFWGFQSDTKEFLKRSDVFVHPSYYEGQPMVLLEALSQQALVVASNIVANVAVLGDQRYGLIMDGVESDQIAKGMINIVDYNFKFEHFDAEQYNRDAVEHFFKQIVKR